MQNATYSAAEAAQLLHVSIPTLKRMCATGEIPSFKTPGGHLRIPLDGLESIQGKRGGSTTKTPSGVLQNRREHVEEISLETQEVRAQRELRKLRLEDAAEAEQRRVEEEARQQETQRRAQAAAQERIDRMNREAHERRRNAELQQTAVFRDRWFQVAESKADDDDRLSAAQRQQVLEALEAEISRRGPDDEGRMETILSRRVKAVVEPWEIGWRLEEAERSASKVKTRVMEVLLFQFPHGATESEKAEASAAMETALDTLPASMPETGLARVARQALSPVQQRVEKRLREERVIQWAVGQLPWLGRTEVDEVHLRRQCREILVGFPADAIEQEMRGAVATLVAAACEEVQRRKVGEERAGRKHGLIRDAELQVFIYLAELKNEEVIGSDELWDSGLRKHLEHAVEQQLQAQLSGDEDASRVKKLVRQIIDTELDIEEAVDD